MPTFPKWDRRQALADLRPLLSRFLRETAREYPIESYVDEIFQLPPGELDYLIATHIMLDRRTAEMLHAAADLIRFLPSSVSRTEEEFRATIRGPVDWSRTVRRRYATGDNTLFICRPTERRYESPLANLLAKSLRECEHLAALTPFDLTRAKAGGIGEEVWLRSREAHRLRFQAKLASLAHGRIRDIAGATTDAIVRRRPAAKQLIDFLELINRAKYQRDPEIVADVIGQRVLAPSQADRLFELQVGLAIVEHLISRGFELVGPPRLLRRHIPLYAGRHQDGRQVQVWWQKETWSLFSEPPTAIRGATLRDADMADGPYRPDLIVIIDPPPRRLLVEVKVTEGSRTADERRGITEMLAYIFDAESVMADIPMPHGLVVAWNATGQPNRSRVMVSDQHNIGRAVDLLL